MLYLCSLMNKAEEGLANASLRWYSSVLNVDTITLHPPAVQTHTHYSPCGIYSLHLKGKVLTSDRGIDSIRLAHNVIYMRRKCLAATRNCSRHTHSHTLTHTVHTPSSLYTIYSMVSYT